MKANQSFYDTLREEVSQDKLRTSHSFLFWGRTIKSVDEPTTTSQASVGEKPSFDDESIRKLKEIIESLQSQVELLEEANLELTKKNKELEAIKKDWVAMTDLDYHDIGAAPEALVDSKQDIALAAKYRQGYISIQKIVNWADELNSEIYAFFIKSMLIDLMPTASVEEMALIRNIGHRPKEPDFNIKVERDLIMSQNITNNVKNVETGAAGIINK